MSKEYWGYLFWGIVFAVVAVPELLAAVGWHVIPFPTISQTTRNLERRYSWTQLVVFAGMATLTVHLAFPALFEKVGLASATVVKKRLPPN
jgi:hypothetical protein